jgi:hypothetical protein|tara:strand:- start:81 stop:326 length:246 start_codon:yes stop_codon:yes gene_type:complete
MRNIFKVEVMPEEDSTRRRSDYPWGDMTEVGLGFVVPARWLVTKGYARYYVPVLPKQLASEGMEIVVARRANGDLAVRRVA